MTFLLFLAGLLALGFFGARFLLHAAWSALFLWWWGAPLLVWIPFLAVVVALGVPALRRPMVTRPLTGFLKKAGLLPAISDTAASTGRGRNCRPPK